MPPGRGGRACDGALSWTRKVGVLLPLLPFPTHRSLQVPHFKVASTKSAALRGVAAQNLWSEVL